MPRVAVGSALDGWDAQTRVVARGRPGRSAVYLAHDLKHERRVALKVLRPELTGAVDDSVVRRRQLWFFHHWHDTHSGDQALRHLASVGFRTASCARQRDT